ncbi:lipid A biosynthesis acyltransferase [Noviherbaspirillum suwonense]|jgi:KDO2-lipid IV(A) lauroyltransferase|uniref:KDO2-lipid IV(A) lauroyltransferase n=1 Tax=Noviherbaspirillum suwonense TaxID=1224511 RepID=A0ABY1Q216_9BURK|nr:lipid A biosynthesis acyltransferase [Noviherbaspirillum suwonense]SMP52867.1 KDO2-lipid IV(A) lauroyltransferase [Noviherbaspirillum suwonense]
MRLLLALMWLLHWLPLPLLGRLGTGVGSLLYLVMGPRRHITQTNLRLCMPELSERERNALARRHFQHYARSVLERGVLWWGSTARLRRLIQVEPGVPDVPGAKDVQDVQREPGVPLAQIGAGPTILLCPHFVCLDVAGVAVMLESSLCSIYTAQRDPVFDGALRRGRTRFRPIELVSRAAGIKPIIRAMRRGLPYFMLPDLDFGARDALFVPFFGVPAATLTAPARIAAATGAKVIPVVATFLPGYRGWKVRFFPAWDDYPGDDLAVSARRMNAFIEARVREAPGEYFWAHKRFKTRPPGVPDVYDASSDSTVPMATDPADGY